MNNFKNLFVVISSVVIGINCSFAAENPSFSDLYDCYSAFEEHNPISFQDNHGTHDIPLNKPGETSGKLLSFNKDGAYLYSGNAYDKKEKEFRFKVQAPGSKINYLIGYTVEAPYTMDVHEGMMRVGESSERDNDYKKSKNKVNQQFKELSYDQTVQLLVKSFKYRLAELELQKKRFISFKKFIGESAYLKESTDINFNNNLYEGLRFLEKRNENRNCSAEEREKYHQLQKCSFYNGMIIRAQEFSKNASSCLKILKNNAEVLSMIKHYNDLKSAKGCTVK